MTPAAVSVAIERAWRAGFDTARVLPDARRTAGARTYAVRMMRELNGVSAPRGPNRTNERKSGR